MKRVLLFILFTAVAASAQLQRYDSFAATTASASGIGNLTQVIANATLTVFNQPAVGVSCAGGGCTAASTFTSRTGATPCGAGVPLTRPTANTCIGTADSQGNFGFWAAAGAYQYCVAATSLTTQCYNVILGPPLDGNNTFTGNNIFSNAITSTSGQVAGNPIPLVAQILQKAETGSADANVLTFTPPAAAGTYRACMSINVASATSGVIGWTLSWTDSNGSSQSAIPISLFQQGVAAPALTFTVSSEVNFYSCWQFDVNNAAASIVFKWVGGGTTAAKVSATIERII